jgi:hypothetical protein
MSHSFAGFSKGRVTSCDHRASAWQARHGQEAGGAQPRRQRQDDRRSGKEPGQADGRSDAQFQSADRKMREIISNGQFGASMAGVKFYATTGMVRSRSSWKIFIKR